MPIFEAIKQVQREDYLVTHVKREGGKRITALCNPKHKDKRRRVISWKAAADEILSGATRFYTKDGGDEADVLVVLSTSPDGNSGNNLCGLPELK